MAKTEKQKGKQKKGAHLKPYLFQPGQSGNPGGRPKGHGFTFYARALAEKEIETHPGMTHMEALVRVAFREALNGNFQFFNLIIERLEGKTPESIHVNSEVSEFRNVTVRLLSDAITRDYAHRLAVRTADEVPHVAPDSHGEGSQ